MVVFLLQVINFFIKLVAMLTFRGYPVQIVLIFFVDICYSSKFSRSSVIITNVFVIWNYIMVSSE